MGQSKHVYSRRAESCPMGQEQYQSVVFVEKACLMGQKKTCEDFKFTKIAISAATGFAPWGKRKRVDFKNR